MGERLLLVDAANVIGSRPDGWWRDRPGAASRLVEQLKAAVADGRLAPPVTVVLEGAARRGVGEGDGPVAVLHAAGSGDDRLVEVAGAATAAGMPVELVTADRELRRRAVAVGATCEGPRWLRRQVDRDG